MLLCTSSRTLNFTHTHTKKNLLRTQLNYLVVELHRFLFPFQKLLITDNDFQFTSHFELRYLYNKTTKAIKRFFFFCVGERLCLSPNTSELETWEWLSDRHLFFSLYSYPQRERESSVSRESEMRLEKKKKRLKVTGKKIIAMPHFQCDNIQMSSSAY